jgi:hypothetical protein
MSEQQVSNLTEKDLDLIINGVVVEKICNISPELNSTRKKSINLRFTVDGVSVRSVLHKAIKQVVVDWQNGAKCGRKMFDSYKDGQTVEIKFTAPAVAPVLSHKEIFAAMTPEQKEAHLKELMAMMANAQ